MSASANKFYPSPYPTWMTPDDIEAQEHVNGYLFIHGLSGVPTWSKYYDPDQPSEDEDSNDYYQRPTPKKVQKPIKPSANRFDVLNKISENATTWTPKKTVAAAKRK